MVLYRLLLISTMYSKCTSYRIHIQIHKSRISAVHINRESMVAICATNLERLSVINYRNDALSLAYLLGST